MSASSKRYPAEVSSCRLCGNHVLPEILDLGVQSLSGVFPESASHEVESSPLRLVKCHGENVCGLVQLSHSFDPACLYGPDYGYRSGLNSSMVAHLTESVVRLIGKVELGPGDLVLDIGSNDGTTLAAYPKTGLDLVGFDPSAERFRCFYPAESELFVGFFSANEFKRIRPGRRAKIVTSFAMFYDLERPLDFMRDVYDVLEPHGVWMFEQSYLPLMLEKNSYDTVCHEHLEYYALSQIKWMTDQVGFTIIDVDFNSINGGSFAVSVTKTGSGVEECSEVSTVLEREKELGLHSLQPYREFAERVERVRASLRNFLSDAAAQGKRVAGIGASTKGNVILQYCGLSKEEIEAIGEVNSQKMGKVTPGSHIGIISQTDLLASNPDYLLVLPWHFRDFFLSAPEFLGRQLLFPLPIVEVRVGNG